MANRNFYLKGANNCWCQLCFKKVKSTEILRRYDNVLCCRECWNPRHPQEYPPRIRSDVPVMISAPPPPPTPNVYIPNPYYANGAACYLYYTQAIPGIAMPGCMIPGRNLLGIVENPGADFITYIESVETD